MYATHLVVICGQSIFADALQAALLGSTNFAVMRFHPHLPSIVDRIVAMQPAVVILERGREQVDLVLALLDQGIPLVTLDINARGGTLLTGRYIPLASQTDMAQLLAHLAMPESTFGRRTS